ncbi:hypothetical protein PEC730217_06430 [Pectobacterium carotovorum subsp. carotovorum]|nr:Hypothetical protein SCC1_0471 [Pectobacterium versatile]MBK4827771.1 hypothetical protein [Pectobacterium carotovorum subsp. carotovorum]AVT60497.1 Hypothetical protein OA04_40260 [Pectobacterium versatile]POY52331.1 hypothetical protein F018LOC_04190 [Pectobacterium versatile]PVY73253.1 hypothetical protein C7330_2424 [Pectobacterium versatile]
MGFAVIRRKKLCSGGLDRRVSDRTSRKPVPRRERVTGGSTSGQEHRWNRVSGIICAKSLRVMGRAAFEPPHVGRVLRRSMKIAALSRTKPHLNLNKNFHKGNHNVSGDSSRSSSPSCCTIKTLYATAQNSEFSRFMSPSKLKWSELVSRLCTLC